jgi:hypothetical protein
MESFDKIGAVNINETNHFVFYNLRNQSDGRDIFLTEALEPYIDVFYQQVTDDWVSVPTKNTITKKKFLARNCTEKDFNRDNSDVNLYPAWEGFSVICPDIPDGQGFQVSDSENKMRDQYYEFTIERCQEDNT